MLLRRVKSSAAQAVWSVDTRVECRATQTENWKKEWKRMQCCACSWCSLSAPLVLESYCWKKLAGFMSARLLLVW